MRGRTSAEELLFCAPTRFFEPDGFFFENVFVADFILLEALALLALLSPSFLAAAHHLLTLFFRGTN